MGFEVTSPYDAKSKLYEGMIITYKIKPLPGIKMNWVTEITNVKEQQYFVDEQRLGPYALWHHEHHFKEIDGRLGNLLLVRREILKIFAYRKTAINGLFGTYRR